MADDFDPFDSFNNAEEDFVVQDSPKEEGQLDTSTSNSVVEDEDVIFDDKDVFIDLELVQFDEEEDGEHQPKYKYRRSFESSLIHFEADENSMQKTESPKKEKSITCFNCLGNHAISDCKEKKDQRKIAENKKKLGFTRPPRKHTGPGTPGAVSDELRRALNLSQRDLPPWIYRMRQTGYPPGYIRKALQKKDDHKDTLHLFDEAGDSPECSNVTSSQLDKDLEVERIVEFPGFNTPVPRGVDDASVGSSMSYPPMLDQHQIDFFVQCFNENRRKLRNATKGNNVNGLEDDDEITVVDMEDVEDEIVMIIPPPPIPPVVTLDEEQVVENIASPPPSSPSPEIHNETCNVALIPTEQNMEDSEQGTSTKRLSFGSRCLGPGTALGIGMHDGVRKTADLSKFAEGIVPFEATQELASDSAGKLDKIMEILQSGNRKRKQEDD